MAANTVKISSPHMSSRIGETLEQFRTRLRETGEA